LTTQKTLPSKNYLLSFLFGALFLIIFSFTAPYTAAPYIVSELGGSQQYGYYIVSFFGLGAAASVPIGRILCTRWGSALIISYCLLVMSILTFGLNLVSSFFQFTLTRFLIGFTTGPFYSAFNELLITLIPTEKKQIFNSFLASFFITIPVIAAAFGGIISYEWEWRGINYILTPLLAVLGILFIKNRAFFPRCSFPKASFDRFGYFLWITTILFLGIALLIGQQVDWFDNITCLFLTIIGLSFLVLFILWNFHTPHPILQLKLLSSNFIFLAVISAAIFFSTYFGIIPLLSTWLKFYANYSSNWIAVPVLTMGIGGIFPFLLFEEKFSSISPKWFLAAGVFLTAISSFLSAQFNSEVDFARIAISRVLAGFGFAIIIPPILILLFSKIPQKRTLEVVEIYQVIRHLSSAFGASIYSTLWQRKEIFYHERLSVSFNLSSQITSEIYQTISDTSNAQVAVAFLESLLQKQSISLALNDCFSIMGYVLLGLFGIILIWPLKLSHER
jgi:DHA2 family multidrug resistance protein